MTDPNERFDFIINKLKKNNHKFTPQRLAVAKILARSEGHPSVEKIYENLQDDFPTMSLATVYRTRRRARSRDRKQRIQARSETDRGREGERVQC
jgi:hypothetical protein